MLECCIILWTRKVVPEHWHLSKVIVFYKKGDLGDCNNYCPISLVCVGYNLFATILLDRLKMGGAESRIWFSQYGFRNKRGATDAIMIVRRVLEEARERKD